MGSLARASSFMAGGLTYINLQSSFATHSQITLRKAMKRLRGEYKELTPIKFLIFQHHFTCHWLSGKRTFIYCTNKSKSNTSPPLMREFSASWQFFKTNMI